MTDAGPIGAGAVAVARVGWDCGTGEVKGTEAGGRGARPGAASVCRLLCDLLVHGRGPPLLFAQGVGDLITLSMHGWYHGSGGMWLVGW